MPASVVAKARFKDYATSVKKALDLIDAAKAVKDAVKAGRLVVLKPNLTIDEPPPTTTPPACTEAVARYCFAAGASKDSIIIAEGSGGCPTSKAFKKLGYDELAQKLNIGLVDLNKEPTVELRNDNAIAMKTFQLPKILEKAFLVSIPTLKEHGDAQVTIAMKNLFGIAPPKWYGIAFWVKSYLHTRYGVANAVVDINSYKPIDLAVVDASVAQKGGEISGEPCKISCILAGFDAVAVDSLGASLLGHAWRDVEHIRLAHERGLGCADLKKIKVIEC